MPECLKHSRSEAYRLVWWYLWDHSDDNGDIRLHVKAMADDLSISRTTAYNVLQFFQSGVIQRWSAPPPGSETCQILELQDAGRNRHCHPAYRLNWKRRAPREFPTPQASVQRRERPYRSKTQRSDAERGHVRSNNPQLQRQRRQVRQGPMSHDELRDHLDACRGWAQQGMVRKVRNNLAYAARHAAWQFSLPRWAQRVTVGVVSQRTREMSLIESVDYTRAALVRLWQYADRFTEWCNWADSELTGRECRRRLWGIYIRLLTERGYVFDPKRQRNRANVRARISGLREWLRDREREYRAGEVCGHCDKVHGRVEFEYGEDEEGWLSCFGFAREKLADLAQAPTEPSEPVPTEALNIDSLWAHRDRKCEIDEIRAELETALSG